MSVCFEEGMRLVMQCCQFLGHTRGASVDMHAEHSSAVQEPRSDRRAAFCMDQAARMPRSDRRAALGMRARDLALALELV